VARLLGHSDTRMAFKIDGHLLAYDDQIQNVQFTHGGTSSEIKVRRFPTL